MPSCCWRKYDGKNDGQLPNGGQQRLETIAALAVRLRETVHRLSQDWESRNRMPQSSAPAEDRALALPSFLSPANQGKRPSQSGGTPARLTH
jgi:hypothetical protein